MPKTGWVRLCLPLIVVLGFLVYAYNFFNVKGLWFYYFHGNRISIEKYVVEMEAGWFPAFDTEQDYIIRMMSGISGKKLTIPTIGLERAECIEFPLCYVNIKLVNEGVVEELFNVRESPKYETEWGEVLFLYHDFDENGDGKFAYYYEKANWVLIVPDPVFLDAIVIIEN